MSVVSIIILAKFDHQSTRGLYFKFMGISKRAFTNRTDSFHVCISTYHRVTIAQYYKKLLYDFLPKRTRPDKPRNTYLQNLGLRKLQMMFRIVGDG